MAMIEWSIPSQSIRQTRGMMAPSKATMEAWYKQARKTIPAIPNLKEGEWSIQHQQATVQWIRYDLVDKVGNKAYLVIDRTKNGLGA